jgi:hypothetical protein
MIVAHTGRQPTFSFVIQSREMDWFKSHVYLASWASPCIAIILTALKGGGKLPGLSWQELIGLIVFCTLIAVAVSPAFDDKARNFAQMFVCFMFGFGVLRGYNKCRLNVDIFCNSAYPSGLTPFSRLIKLT